MCHRRCSLPLTPLPLHSCKTDAQACRQPPAVTHSCAKPHKIQETADAVELSCITYRQCLAQYSQALQQHAGPLRSPVQILSPDRYFVLLAS